jgi:hypothetical protein
MTRSLSFLFQAKAGAGEDLASAIGDGAAPAQAQAESSDPAPAPAVQILHYIWLVVLPIGAPLSPPGYTTLLLNTVYDEDFTSYISKLVKNNPGPFNAAAAKILGFEGINNRLPDPAAMQEFIALIAQRDLTQTAQLGQLVSFYPYTAAAIINTMGGGDDSDPASTGS